MAEYVMAWTSDGSGAVSGHSIAVQGGALRSLKVVPGTGDLQPTNAYSVQLLDQDGVDLLSGMGVARSNVTPELLIFDPPIPWVGRRLQPVIAGAGAANAGRLTLIVD
jgi:hypothetical protein